MNIKFALISMSVLALTACGNKESYTVDYLKENPTVLAKVLEECKANKQSNENCQNANQAKDELDTEEKKNKRGLK